jgi:hypothetical protein
VGVGDSTVAAGLGDTTSAGDTLGDGLTLTVGVGVDDGSTAVGSLARATPGRHIWPSNITLTMMFKPLLGIFMVDTPCMRVKD